MRSLATALTAGPLPLDGGLGTLLEQHGHDLSSSLWSARMLLDAPDAITAAHSDFFAAGARVGISSSYQVSYEAMASIGIDTAGTDRLLVRSVELLDRARQETAGAGERWIAASVGPYGAMLADGSEYRGDYGMSVAALREWHRPRLLALAASNADVLAIETIPCLAEVEALVSELDGTGIDAWLSVTVALGELRSGEAMSEAFAMAADVDEIVAVGINCSDPLDVTGAIAAARSVTTKPIVVYPNSGEQWDAKNKTWMGHAGFPNALVREWVTAGANLIGGCCRVGPAEVARITRQLV